MSIAQNSYAFGSPACHGTPMVETPSLQHETYQIFGVEGVAHNIGKRGSRSITIEVTYSGYANEPALQTAIAGVQDRIGTLTGTMSTTIESQTTNYGNCTFMGFTPSGTPFKDGSGVYGWVQKGTLTWIQRKPD